MKYRFYYLAMCTTIISHFVLYAPFRLKENFYNGTSIAILLALISSCANAYMTVYVYNAYKSLNLLDINKNLLGKFLGGTLSLFNILGNLTISFFMYRGLLEIVKRFMLPSTPIWILAPTLLIVFYINILHTNKSFLNFMGLISIFVILSSLVYILLSTKSFHMYYAKAAFIHSFKMPKLLTIGAACFYFTGVSHLALFNPEFKKISFMRTFLIYIFVGTTVAILAVFLPAGMIGPYLMQKTLLTVMSASETIAVDLFFIERATYILLPMAFLLAASDMLIWGYVGWGLLRTAIPKKKINLLLFFTISILFAVGASLLKSSKDLLELGTTCITIALIYHYCLFAVLFILTKLKEGKNS